MGSYWLVGIGFRIYKMKRIMEVDGGNEYTTLKMVKMVNLILCVF